eukprot:353633-Chlamydomonas_euryale.AAC.5
MSTTASRWLTRAHQSVPCSVSSRTGLAFMVSASCPNHTAKLNVSPSSCLSMACCCNKAPSRSVAAVTNIAAGNVRKRRARGESRRPVLFPRRPHGCSCACHPAAPEAARIVELSGSNRRSTCALIGDRP